MSLMKRIVVNGDSWSVGSADRSYEEIVQMAGYNQRRVYTVTYTTRRKGDEQRQGTLTTGKSTPIEDGMIFDVADTSK